VGIPAGEVAIETETRIARMVELMLANEWRTGKTVKQLAAEWGITAQRARMLSAEASKIVRQELLANVSSLIVPSMTNIITTGPEGGPGDKMAAVQAARMLADIAGLTQHEKESEPEHREQTLKVQFVAPERPKEKSE
jgi:hypothetical protein